MPKRSNEFQRLVALLTMVKSDGAIVRESVEIETLDGGRKRETDVVAVGAVAGHRTVVAIEARDTKRKQDVLWVEQAKTKFERLGANVKILVSSSGFTAEALESATKFGIKTITPGDVTEEFVGRVVNSATQAEYHHWVTLVKKTEIIVSLDGQIDRRKIGGTFPIFTGDGVQVGMFDGLVEQVRKHHTQSHQEHWDEVAREGEEQYGTGKFQFLATGDYPDPKFNDQKIYVKGLDPAGREILLELVNVIVTFEAKRIVADVSLRHGEYDGTYFSTGTGALGDAMVQLVYTETPEGGFDMVGRIDGPLDTLVGLKTEAEGYDADSQLSNQTSSQ